jgi:hypothetical protein
MLSIGISYVFKANKGVLSALFSSILISLSMFTFVYIFIKKYYKFVFKGMFVGKLNFNFFYTIIPAIVGTMMLNMVLNNLIPTTNDSTYIKFMTEVASNKNFITLFMIPIVIIAPITEELIFRGMLLRGIASNHKPAIAIIASATMFSLIHLNLAQIPNAFILGVIFAFLMIHTRNITYTIIYHAINNFLVTFMLYFIDPKDLEIQSTNSTEVISPLMLIVLAFLGVSFIYLGLKWTISTITNEKRSFLPSDEVYTNYLSSFTDELENIQELEDKD